MDPLRYNPIVDFCSLEVQHQGFDINDRSGKIRVLWMYNAWCLIALEEGFTITPESILRLGRMVEPVLNNHGFRTVPVTIGNTIIRADTIRDNLERLCALGKDLSPGEFYKAFEEIHPFQDGNGRVGKILFNHLNNTLHDPVFPPRFFGEVS